MNSGPPLQGITVNGGCGLEVVPVSRRARVGGREARDTTARRRGRQALCAKATLTLQKTLSFHNKLALAYCNFLPMNLFF